MSTSSVRGYLLAILTALLWSAIYPLSRFCMEQEMPPLELAFWRALLAGLLFLLYAFWNRRLRVPLRLALQLMLFGAVGIAGYFALVFFTIQGCGVAMSSILMYTAPPG